MHMTWKQYRWILLWAANLILIIGVWASLSWRGATAGTVPMMLMSFSRLAALLAAYCLVVQFWLIGRSAWLEQDFGLDRLTRIHRWNGFATVSFVIIHAFSLFNAQSMILGVQVPEAVTYVLSNYEDTTKALIAELSLVLVVVTSLVIVRRKLPYEFWYYVHLLTYIAIVFSFGHQVHNGQHLLSYQWFQVYWYALFGISGAIFVIYRFIRPAWLWQRHRFVVTRVAEEASGVRSIYIGGKNIQDFSYTAGQFAKFWFVAKGFWLEEHPFTISLEPGGEELRITPKELGDFTARMKRLPVGTPVVVDGPYGRFTQAVATTKKLVMIAGGIGITPMRAMLGALTEAKDKRDIVLYYSVKSPVEFVFTDELKRFHKDLNLTIYRHVTEGNERGTRHDLLTAELIKQDLGSLAKADFYVCGPPGMTQALRKGLAESGVKPEHVHYELFSLVRS